jgi:hypothetical protein
MKYIAMERLMHLGRIVERSETVELTETQAAALAGLVIPIVEQPASTSTPIVEVPGSTQTIGTDDEQLDSNPPEGAADDSINPVPSGDTPGDQSPVTPTTDDTKPKSKKHS